MPRTARRYLFVAGYGFASGIVWTIDIDVERRDFDGFGTGVDIHFGAFHVEFGHVAAIDIDFGHDAADLARQVTAPALVLYGAEGAMAQAMDVAATWAPRLADMRHEAIPGGHFFPDQSPQETAQALRKFILNLP